MGKALLYELGSSTSFAQLCLKGKVLWPMLLAASDDQGRGLAEDKTVKWKVCPNVMEITVEDIPGLLAEMESERMICLYRDERGRLLYQISRWWEYQNMQWAQPSKYEPPEGWTDRVRVNRRDTGYFAENWNSSGGFSAHPIEPAQQESPEPPGPGKPDGSLGESPGGNAGTNPGGALNQLKSTESNPNPPRGADAPPVNLQDWLTVIQATKNRPAALRQMFEQLFPNHDAPHFGRIGKAAQRVGGAGRLAGLMWHASARPPNGNPLDYIEATEKRRKKEGKGSNGGEPLGFQGIRDYLEEEGIETPI